MNDDGPTCAHLQVRHAPVRHDDGTYTDRWECEACGQPFGPYKSIDLISRRLDRPLTPEEQRDHEKMRAIMDEAEAYVAARAPLAPANRGTVSGVRTAAEAANEPQRQPPCAVCGAPTAWACADCGIDSGGRTSTHVCPECRDAHEAAAHGGAGPDLAEEDPTRLDTDPTTCEHDIRPHRAYTDGSIDGRCVRCGDTGFPILVGETWDDIEPAIGGDPPPPEVGMVIDLDMTGRWLVTHVEPGEHADPWHAVGAVSTPAILAIYAPWGGPCVWRRE